MKLNKNQVHNKPVLKSIRKELRNNSTRAEVYLWQFLQNRKFEDRKFRRQHSIGNYIVDFYCPAERIILELDGDVHNNFQQKEKDKIRDDHLMEMGFKVLRFKNEQVLNYVDQVLQQIKENFQ
jgi:very-short-patch-repair endonuclease